MSEILTSEKFLSQGLKFPPAVSEKRLQKYDINLKRLKGTYNQGRKLKIVTPEGVVTSDLKILPLNYFKLDTEKQEVLTFQEVPIWHCRGLDDELVKDILESANFYETIKKAGNTAYSLGDGPILISQGGTPKTSYFNPKYYYEVVEDYDINETKCVVLVHFIYREWLEGQNLKSEVNRLRVIRHYRGYYTEQVFQYHNGILGRPITYTMSNGRKIPTSGARKNTGIDDILVQVLKHDRAIDDVHGTSAFEDYKDLVYAIEKRVTLEDAVIDKHSEPTFAVPSALLKTDGVSGEVKFKGVGGIIGVPSGAENPEYITWDGKTDASEKLIETLKKELVTKLEYGEVYLYNQYTDASGEALKTLLKGALDKASRILNNYEQTAKKVVKILLQLHGYKDIKIEDISVEWQDGIVETEKTKAETIKSRTESGTMSKKRALMIYDNLTEEHAEKELEQINKENNIDTVKGDEIDERINTKIDAIFSTGE